MKPTPIALVLAFLVATPAVFGQSFAFKVLANKGNNEVKTGDTWQPIKIGASLQSDEELRVVANGYLGLIHASGTPIEVKDARTYKVADLEPKNTAGSSVVSKYTDFILSSTAEDKKNKLSATGAVHRALDESTIAVMLPEDNNEQGIYNNHAIIQWQASKVPGPYVVTLKNMFDDVLSKIETPETKIDVDLNDAKLANENAILVTVSVKSDPKQVSKQYLIKRLTSADRSRIDASLKELMVEVSDPTALNSLILAGFYEENNLVLDAMSSYAQAVQLAPDVTTYKDAYDEFLLRKGLKKE